MQLRLAQTGAGERVGDPGSSAGLPKSPELPKLPKLEEQTRTLCMRRSPPHTQLGGSLDRNKFETVIAGDLIL